MLEKTTHVPILVRDQDKALEFYVEKLGFEKRNDYALKGLNASADASGSSASPAARPRWLTVALPGAVQEFALVKGEFVSDPRTAEGYQFTLTTSDCRGEVAKLRARGVAFREPAPVDMPFGIVASFADPDGNRFSLLQPAKGGK